MTRKLRKGDFMEGDLEIRMAGGGGRGQSKEKFFLATFIPFLSTNKWGGRGLGPSPASANDNAFLYNL